MTIKILHLYNDLMNLYGEYGNINILKSHLEDQNVQVEVSNKTINDDYNLMDYDFIYCGSGLNSHLDLALNDFKKHKDELKQYVDSNKVSLFTGNSLEMLGKKIYILEDNEEKDLQEGLGFFNFKVQRLKDCKTNDIIYDSELLNDTIVGFVNKQANIYDNDSHLFKVKFGIGENEKSDYEGAKINNLYATYVIGPILVRNPHFLKKIVEDIIKSKDSSYDIKDIPYENEEEGYNLVLNELMNRIG